MIGQVGLDVSAHEVLLRRFLLGRSQLHGIVQHGDHVREGVPEKATDPDGDVDPRPGQLGQGDRFQCGDPAGRVVPDRAHPEQGQYLGHVVTAGPHRAGAPHGKTH